MLTRFYRKSTAPSSTGTVIANKPGIMGMVLLMNDNATESSVRLFIDGGMVFFDIVLAPKENRFIKLDTLLLQTDTVKVTTGLSNVHVTINFLEKI